MSREWKPGDVATLVMEGETVRGIVRDHRDDVSPVWVISGHSFFKSVGVNNGVLIDEARPLVVIDPEDREQVERFVAAVEAAAGKRRSAKTFGVTQAALREFANPKPPKPDEPTGLGAVVEDVRGIKWTRAGSSHVDGNWLRVGSNAYVYYDAIAAVRVLSEGVQP